MKTVLCLGVSLLGLLASVVSASAVENEARVVTSRALRIAAVRDSSSSAHWYIVQQAFGTSMAASLSVPGVSSMPVKMITVDAADVANDLLSGKYDAVLLVGERLPSELRSNGFHSTRAVAEIGVPVRVFHFVIRADDSSAVHALSGAFQKATSSVYFQETVGRAGAMRVFADSRDLLR